MDMIIMALSLTAPFYPLFLAIALTVAFVINFFVICVFGAVSWILAGHHWVEVVDSNVFCACLHFSLSVCTTMSTTRPHYQRSARPVESTLIQL